MGPHSDVVCRVDYTPASAGSHSRDVTVTAEYSGECKSEVYAKLKAARDARAKPLEKQLLHLRNAGPDTVGPDKRLSDTKNRLEGERSAVQAALADLAGDSPEILTRLSERAKLARAKSAKLRELRGQVAHVIEVGPSLNIIEQLRKTRTAKYHASDKLLAKKFHSAEQQLKLLKSQLAKALSELRKHGRCRACNDTYSEYHDKGRHHDESWQEHVRRNGLKSATQKDLDEKRAQYEHRMAPHSKVVTSVPNERSSLKVAHEKSMKELDDKEELLRKRHEKRIDELNARISEMDSSYSEQLALADKEVTKMRAVRAKKRARLRKRLGQIKKELAAAAAVHDREVKDAQRIWEKKTEELQENIDGVRNAYRKARRAADTRFYQRRKTIVRLRGLARKPMRKN